MDSAVDDIYDESNEKGIYDEDDLNAFMSGPKKGVSYFDGFSTIKICKVEECDEDILCLKC